MGWQLAGEDFTLLCMSTNQKVLYSVRYDIEYELHTLKFKIQNSSLDIHIKGEGR